MIHYAQCTHCQAKFKAKPELAGRNVRCPKCKQVFKVQLTDVGPTGSESAASLSASKLSQTPGVGESKFSASSGESRSKSSAFQGISEAAKKSPAERPPRWAGEPPAEQVSAPSDAERKGPRSPVLNSNRTISGVILPGNRHVPALEVPWGSPCNPPKDFLKEQAGGSAPAVATSSVKEHVPLLPPEQKEIRIERSDVSDDGAIVESETYDVAPPVRQASGDAGDEDALIAGVMDEGPKKPSRNPLIMEETATLPTGHGEFAGTKVLKASVTDEVVTADDQGGFYRPALPGQHDDIYGQDPSALEKALVGARTMLARDATYEELDAVEGSKYVPQVRQVLANELGFGASATAAPKSSTGIPPALPFWALSGAGAVLAVVVLIYLVGVIRTAVERSTVDSSEYVTQSSSQFPAEALGPAGLVAVKFPAGFEPVPVLERPWLEAEVEGFRIIRPNDAFVMLYSSTIPGKPPANGAPPSREQLEVFGLQQIFASNPYLAETKRLALDGYPLVEYRFDADILRMRKGKSRLALLYSKQRMFVFLWSGSQSSSEAQAFFESIRVKGSSYPTSG